MEDCLTFILAGMMFDMLVLKRAMDKKTPLDTAKKALKNLLPVMIVMTAVIDARVIYEGEATNYEAFKLVGFTVETLLVWGVILFKKTDRIKKKTNK